MPSLPIDTKDLASTDEDGFLWFAGRQKDMISRGGLKHVDRWPLTAQGKLDRDRLGVDGRFRRRPGTLRQEACRDHVIGFMITLGKAVKPAMPKGGQLALSEVLVQDRFA